MNVCSPKRTARTEMRRAHWSGERRTNGVCHCPCKHSICILKCACQGFPETLCRSAGKETMRNRNYEVHVYLNEEEFRMLDRLSHKTGLNFSTIVRKMISGATLIERPNRDYRELVRSIDRIGNNYNQLVHRANMTNNLTQEDMQQSDLLLRSIRNEIESWKEQWL